MDDIIEDIIGPIIEDIIGPIIGENVCDEVPTFEFSFTDSLVPRKGNAIPTFTRGSIATVLDFEGNHHLAEIDELRIQGARYVRNLLKETENFGSGFWNKGNGATVTSGEMAPDLTMTAWEIDASTNQATVSQNITTIPGDYIFSVWLKSATVPGTWNIVCRTPGFNPVTHTLFVDLTTEWKRFAVPVCTILEGNTDITSYIVGFQQPGELNKAICWGAQLEKVTQPGVSGYVSNNVLSWPYHGLGVDGVRAFRTDRAGKAIAVDGALIEDEGTNRFLNSDIPATQTISLTVGEKYVVQIKGTGYLNINGASPNSMVDEGSPVTFTASTSSLTCTPYNSVEMVQVEWGEHPSSYIPTGSSMVTRSKDNLSYDVASDITQGEGSIYFEFVSNGRMDWPYLFSLDDGTWNNRIFMYLDYAQNNRMCFIGNVNNVESWDIIGSNIVFSNKNKMLAVYSEGKAYLYLNGNLVGSATFPEDIPIVNIFHIGGNPIGQKQLNGIIKCARLYDKPMITAKAKRLTA